MVNYFITWLGAAEVSDGLCHSLSVDLSNTAWTQRRLINKLSGNTFVTAPSDSVKIGTKSSYGTILIAVSKIRAQKVQTVVSYLFYQFVYFGVLSITQLFGIMSQFHLLYIAVAYNTSVSGKLWTRSPIHHFGRPCYQGADPAGCGLVSGIFSFGFRGPSPQALTPFGEVWLIARRLRCP